MDTRNILVIGASHGGVEALQRLAARFPEDLAAPNHHLLLKEDQVAVRFGPKENRSRPSIDALLRSAAAYHGRRVMAVLLTGYLHDGVSRLAAVKRCGGIALMQDPAEAEAAELPNNAIRRVLNIDHVLPLADISEKIVELIGQPVGKAPEIPEEIMEDVPRPPALPS